MTINVGTFETALQAKFNAANSTTAATDFVYLAKASDQLEFTLNQATANFESLPAAANSSGRIQFVTSTGKIYYSDGSSWTALVTSENPNFLRQTLADETVTVDDAALITDSVTVSEDNGLITATVTSTEDNGSELSIVNKGTLGDIYVDPNQFTFTYYDGVTRGGVKHMRADMNNIQLNSKIANNVNMGMYSLAADHTTTADIFDELSVIPWDNDVQVNTNVVTRNSDGTFNALNSGKYLIKIKGVLTGSSSFWIGFGKLGPLDPLDTVHKVPGLIGYENTWKYFSSATEFEHETIVHISNVNDRIVSYIFNDTLLGNVTFDSKITGSRTPLLINASSYGGNNITTLKIEFLGK